MDKDNSEQNTKSIVDKHGKLRVSSNKIIDQNNKPVILRGMSLFWSQFIDKYYNYECIKWLRDDWKCTIIRAPVGIEKQGYLENPELELIKICKLIDICIDLGIYIIVDWHDHQAHNHLEEAKSFFKIFAQMYGNKPNIIYEIYNEPLEVSWLKQIKPYAEKIIRVIRETDSDNIIVVGTPSYSQDVDSAANDPLDRYNIAYTLHFYASSHTQWLRDKALIALKKGLALFITEWGTCEYAGDGKLDLLETEKWIQFMNENNISWCNWTIADKNETSSALMRDANEKGGWNISELSESGKFVREQLIQLNKST